MYVYYYRTYKKAVTLGFGNKRPFEAACIVTLSEDLVFEKVPSGPWNHRSPRGAFTLLGPDSIFLFDFW